MREPCELMTGVKVLCLISTGYCTSLASYWCSLSLFLGTSTGTGCCRCRWYAAPLLTGTADAKY